MKEGILDVELMDRLVLGEGEGDDEDILHYYPLAKTQLAQLAQL
jgi:hypothetical protein